MKRICCFFLLLFITVNIATAQNVGIGTSAPTDKLHVNGAAGANPFLIQVNGLNKLRVNANGGTSIGSAVVAPANGLYVAGVTNPVGGIRSSSNPISIQSNNDSVEIIAGNNKIVISANGGIRIITANGTSGITIDAGAGDLNLKGNNINITAANKCTSKANKLFTVSTDSTYFSTIDGNIALNAARSTDITSGINLSLTTSAAFSVTTGASMTVTTGIDMNVTTGGNTGISSIGKTRIATNTSMDLAVGTNYTLTTGGAMAVIPGTSYLLDAAGDVTIQSFGNSYLKGALVILNNGTRPAARLNDGIQTLFTNGTGIITTGSSSVLIGN